MKLSIVTINYNNSSGLKTTADSVAAQTTHNFEWIVIDGGSSDGSIEVIKSFSSYIKYWVSEPDGGIYPAMNKGIRNSTGDYLLFLNSGDYLYSKSVIEELFLINHTKDLLVGRLCKVRNGQLIVCPDYLSEDITASDIILKPIPHQATFIHRSLFSRFGYYDEKYRIVSDWKFFMQCVVWGDVSIELLGKPISVFDETGISNTQTELNDKERNAAILELFPRRLMKDLSLSASLNEVRRKKWARIVYSMLYRMCCLK